MADTVLTKSAADAIRSLFATGVEESEIHELVTTVATETRPVPQKELDVSELPVYDKDTLPDDLIDLPKAAKNTGRSTGTIRMWIRNGRLEAVARLRAGAPGGGYLVVRRDDLAHIHDVTPKRNR